MHIIKHLCVLSNIFVFESNILFLLWASWMYFHMLTGSWWSLLALSSWWLSRRGCFRSVFFGLFCISRSSMKSCHYTSIDNRKTIVRFWFRNPVTLFLLLKHWCNPYILPSCLLHPVADSAQMRAYNWLDLDLFYQSALVNQRILPVLKPPPKILTGSKI